MVLLCFLVTQNGGQTGCLLPCRYRSTKVHLFLPLSLSLYLSFSLSLSLLLSLSLSLSYLPLSFLPSIYLALPVDDEDDDQGLTSPQHTDSFDEVYKPFELTDFDGLLAKNIGRPIE